MYADRVRIRGSINLVRGREKLRGTLRTIRRQSQAWSGFPFENERLEKAGRRRTLEFLYGTIGGRWNILRSIRYVRRLIAEWQADRY